MSHQQTSILSKREALVLIQSYVICGAKYDLLLLFPVGIVTSLTFVRGWLSLPQVLSFCVVTTKVLIF